jgi:hypothetical protein
MNARILFPLVVLLVIFAACARAELQSEPELYFSVAVITDTTTDSVSRDQIDEIVSSASLRLEELTGFSLQVEGYFETDQGGTVEEIVQNYMNLHSADLPNGVILFSAGDADRAKINRGYSQKVLAPAGFHNAFVSSAGEMDQMYVAVVYFNYLYAACGYGGTDGIQSAFPIGDECGGDTVACAQWNGKQVCERALPFLTTPTDMIAGVVVHEFMHPFDWEIGPDIHYTSKACAAAMGWPTDHFDYEESEHFVGMCPYVFDNFVNAYRP